MKKVDQGDLPKPEVSGLTCPGRESNPGAGLHGERRAQKKAEYHLQGISKASASCQAIRHLQVLVFNVKQHRSRQGHHYEET
jgi:hypothetical protein